MKPLSRIFLIVILVTLFSTVSYAQRAEYKKLNQRMALLYKNGRLDEAIDVCIEVVRVAEKTFGRNHAYVSSSLSNLALLYFKNEKYELAKTNYEQALAIKESLLGKNHPQLVSILKDIQKCCRKLHDTEGSELIAERLESLQRSLGG